MSVAHADSQALSSNESARVTADTQDTDTATESYTAAAAKTESLEAQSTKADSGDNAQIADSTSISSSTSKSIACANTSASIRCSSADKKSDAAEPDIAKQELEDKQGLEDEPLFRHAESEAAPIEQGTAATQAEEHGDATRADEHGTAASSSMQLGERASMPNVAREQNMYVANAQGKLGGNDFEGVNASNVSVQKESEKMQGERRVSAAKVAPEGEKISLSEEIAWRWALHIVDALKALLVIDQSQILA